MPRLTKDYQSKFLKCGWAALKIDNDIYLSVDFGSRQITMAPSLAHTLRPMVFRSQAMVHVTGYSRVAEEIGYKYSRYGPGIAHDSERYTFDELNEDTARILTENLRKWAFSFDPVKHVSERLRLPPSPMHPNLGIVDLAFLARSDVLENILRDMENGQANYLAKIVKKAHVKKALKIAQERCSGRA